MYAFSLKQTFFDQKRFLSTIKYARYWLSRLSDRLFVLDRGSSMLTCQTILKIHWYLVNREEINLTSLIPSGSSKMLLTWLIIISHTGSYICISKFRLWKSHIWTFVYLYRYIYVYVCTQFVQTPADGNFCYQFHLAGK